jgi:hypothetical protein
MAAATLAANAALAGLAGYLFPAVHCAEDILFYEVTHMLHRLHRRADGVPVLFTSGAARITNR